MITFGEKLKHLRKKNHLTQKQLGISQDDETRKARQKLSAIILNNLDGWEDEYEQIRKDGRL